MLCRSEVHLVAQHIGESMHKECNYHLSAHCIFSMLYCTWVLVVQSHAYRVIMLIHARCSIQISYYA